jgi:hypothetical protein
MVDIYPRGIIYGKVDINSYMKHGVVVLIIGIVMLVSLSSGAYTEITSSKDDGYMLQSLAPYTWDTFRDATDCNTIDAYLEMILRADNDPYYSWNVFHRYGFVFDTSSLPDGAVINSIQLKFTTTSLFNTLEDSPEWSLIAVPYNPTSNTSASVTTDYDAAFPLSQGATYGVLDSDDMVVGANYITLSNFSWVNTTGYSRIGLMFNDDFYDTEPTVDTSPAGYPNYGFGGASGGHGYLLITYNTTSPYTASFTASDTSGELPLEVVFTDNSIGFPESYPYPTYVIYFGDGSSFSGERQYTGEVWTHEYNYPGVYNVTYIITHNGIGYSDNETITVSQIGGAPAGYQNLEVKVHGLNTAPIDGANVSIYYNGAYKGSDGTSGAGSAYFVVPRNTHVTGTVTHPGYQDTSFTQYVATWDTWTSVTLYADDEIPWTGDEYWTYAVTFRDANTHENLDLVFIDLYTDSDREDLFLSEYRNGGVWTGLLPNNTTFYATASAANYVNLEWSFTLNGASQSVYKDLVPVTYGSLQPVLNIFVYDTGGTALNGVGVTVDSDIDDGFHLTNSTGYARHFCDNLAYGSSRNYTITAQKGGYVTESSTVTVSTQQPTVYIFMEKSAVPTATYTGVYTPVVTPVWSGDGGEPGNIKEQLINTLMTQFGLSQLEANILMGIILTLLCAVTVGGGLASYGSGSGAGVGAMIGAVVGFSGSSIIGFFPIWILIVVIVLVFAAWFMFRGRDE